VALTQARKEILKYHNAKELSELAIMMDGLFLGLEIDFQGRDNANTYGKVRIFFVQNSGSRSGRPRPRLYGVEALGSKEFLESPQTKEVLQSLKIRTKP